MKIKGLPVYHVDHVIPKVVGVPKLEEWKPEPKRNFTVEADYIKPPIMEDPRITRLKLLALEKKLEKL